MFIKLNGVGVGRRKYILDVLLLGFFGLGVVASCVDYFFYINEGVRYDGSPPVLVLIFTLFFLSLYFFSRAGKSKFVIFVFLLVSVLPFYFGLWKWGFYNPQILLFGTLSIIMAGVLVNSQFSFLVLVVHSIFLIIVSYLQSFNIVIYSSFWINSQPTIGDGISSSAMLTIIAIVSWLSNREIEKALKRAKRSELALKKERDGLEIEVERRTEELKKVQLEKMTLFYRFANYGRIAAGLFHDIANPLTQVSLSLNSIEYRTKNKLLSESKEIEPIIKRAINGTKQMEKFMMMLKKQIQQQEMEKNYKPWEEIKMAIENFEYKARKMKVQIEVTHKKNIYTVGNSLRFYQMVSNLISNALDSYHEIQREENRKVFIKLDADKSEIILTVKDFGCGMSKEIMKKIFGPWFTTKDPKRGTGVGLYMTKKIVEEEFKGKIKVKSKLNEGTLFTVKFPIKTKLDERQN